MVRFVQSWCDLERMIRGPENINKWFEDCKMTAKSPNRYNIELKHNQFKICTRFNFILLLIFKLCIVGKLPVSILLLVYTCCLQSMWQITLIWSHTVEVGSLQTLRLESLKLVFQPLHKCLVKKLQFWQVS